MAVELSQAGIAQTIRDRTRMVNGCVDQAAAEIWASIATYIEETENRIIDAEFKATDLERQLGNAKAAGDCAYWEQSSCCCGAGDEPCPGPDGKPLCARAKGVAMQTTLNIVFIAFIVIVVGKKLFVWFMEG